MDADISRSTLPLSGDDLAAITHHVRVRIAAPIHVEELAGVVGMSTSCFARLFKQAAGVTPHQFILQERVRTASELIREGNGLSLAQIAVRAGFSDQAHLTRVFRQITGRTPADFCRNGESESTNPAF